jgi:hypothetical protein
MRLAGRTARNALDTHAALERESLEGRATIGATRPLLRAPILRVSPSISAKTSRSSSKMSRDPARTAIYHITQIRNLASVIASGCLMSDARRRSGEFNCINIGHMHIKNRRMDRAVPVAAKGVLGDYVPFNFCVRSVMLYPIHTGKVDGYDGGDREVIHICTYVADAIGCGQPWTFTDRHAELSYASFYETISELDRVDWNAMPLLYWSDSKRNPPSGIPRSQSFPLGLRPRDWCA